MIVARFPDRWNRIRCGANEKKDKRTSRLVGHNCKRKRRFWLRRYLLSRLPLIPSSLLNHTRCLLRRSELADCWSRFVLCLSLLLSPCVFCYLSLFLSCSYLSDSSSLFSGGGMFVIVCVRLRIRGSRWVVKIREKQKKNTETRLVMRAGPELGKKSAGVLRREGSLPGGRVCAIRLISDRVQFRLRTRSYGPRSSPDSIVPIVFVRFGSVRFWG